MSGQGETIKEGTELKGRRAGDMGEQPVKDKVTQPPVNQLKWQRPFILFVQFSIRYNMYIHKYSEEHKS